MSDSQSSSSVENHSPVSRERRKDGGALRRLAQRVTQQKQLIMRALDSHCPKAQIDAQIHVICIFCIVFSCFVGYYVLFAKVVGSVDMN